MIFDFGIFDLVLILGFIAVNVVVGFSTRGYVKNFDSYASGNNVRYNGITIASTIVAFFCSASAFVCGIEQIYTDGLMMIWYVLIAELVACLFSIFICTPKIIKIKTYSLYQYLGHFYGSNIRALFALCESIKRIGKFAIQLRLIGKCADYAFGLNGTSNAAIWFSALFLILYASFGGLKAVSHTDVVQAVSFFIIIPLISFALWYRTSVEFHNHSGFYSIFRGEYAKFTVSGSFNSVMAVVVAISILLKAIAGTLSVPYFQRVGMCKTVARAQKLWGIGTALYAVFLLFVVFIALQLFGITHPTGEHVTKYDLRVNDIIPYMLNFLNSPTISVLFFILIVSLSVSTSDSEFNGIAVLFSNDILGKINNKLYQNKTAATVSSILACVLALILALSFDNIFTLLMSVQNFFLPVVIIPLLWTIFGLRTHKNAIWTGVICGIVVTLLFSITFGIILNPKCHDSTFLGFHINSIIQDWIDINPSSSIGKYAKFAFGPGMFANFVGIMLAHFYYKKKGWKWDGTEPDAIYSQEETMKILDKSRGELILKLRGMAILQKYGIEEMHDEDVITKFYMLDFVSDLPEYQKYKELLFQYRIKRPFKLHDRESDFDPEFQRQLCIDCLHPEDKIEYFKSQENSEKIDEIVKEMKKGM